MQFVFTFMFMTTELSRLWLEGADEAHVRQSTPPTPHLTQLR